MRQICPFFCGSVMITYLNNRTDRDRVDAS